MLFGEVLMIESLKTNKLGARQHGSIGRHDPESTP